MNTPINDERLKPVNIQNPLVTIIITSYNYGKYITACLNSVAGQTYLNFDCIIVDDLSTDGSVHKIEEFIALNDHRKKFRLVQHVENSGQMGAFKTGLEHASGTFVVFLDADDLLLEDFLVNHTRYHLEYSPVAFTSSNQYQINENDEITAGSHPDLQSKGKVQLIRPSSIHTPFWIWATTSSMMFRTAVLRIVMPENHEKFRICADNFICHFSNILGGSLLIPEVFGCYRRHIKNSFCQNPLIGGRLPTGDMTKHPEHCSVREEIIEHLLKNSSKFVSLLSEYKYLKTITRVAGPYEILRDKNKYTSHISFLEGRLPYKFILASLYERVMSILFRHYESLTDTQ